MKSHAAIAASFVLALAAGDTFSEPLKSAEFSWRAKLELPAGASLGRVSLPPQALMQLQSRDARDVRVFNGSGEAVAHAFARPPAPPRPMEVTQSYNAHPLFSARQGLKPGAGAVRVRIDGTDAAQSVWVQIDGAKAPPSPPAEARRLNSAVFDTRAENRPIRALTVQAELPPNSPVRITAASSADLSQWTPVALRGRLYRFEGADAPVNSTLDLEQPLRLEHSYLRLDWEGHDGVKMSSVSGVIATETPPRRVSAALPLPARVGNSALEWQLPFATPISALGLTTPQNNSLVPFRILGRNDLSQPWRQVAQTLVYRLGPAGSETTNPAVPLHGATMRWLRVEATHGMELSGQPFQASVEFEPVQLVFVASGSAPFELAAGRAATPSTSIAVNLLAAASPGKIDDLPEAKVGTVTASSDAAAAASTGPFAWLVPAGVPSRTLWLWGVLGGGVLLLGGVAWSLLRQLKTLSPPQ